jgi:hypothetical protein
MLLSGVYITYRFFSDPRRIEGSAAPYQIEAGTGEVSHKVRYGLGIPEGLLFRSSFSRRRSAPNDNTMRAMGATNAKM